MNNRWGNITFGEILACPTRNGIHKGVAFQGKGIPVIKMGEVYQSRVITNRRRDLLDLSQSEIEKLLILVDDLLFCRTSLVAEGVGHCAIVKEIQLPTTFASNLIRARINKNKAEPDFYRYYFSSQQGVEQLLSIARGTTVTTITGPDISSLSVPFPPLPEQRAIADVLSALDDKIELNRRMNATLEQLARAIFKHMFIDNPESEKWEKGFLSDICEVTIGGDWGKETSIGEDVEVICLRGVDLEHLRNQGYSPEAPIRWIKNSSLEKRRMSSSDVLIAGSGIGPVGRPIWISPALLNLYPKEVTYSNFCKRLRSKSPAFAVFLDRILHNMHQNNEILDFVNGTSLPNLDIKGLLNNYPIKIPPSELVDKYYAIVEPTYSLLFNGESQTLTNLRNTLLPKLMSGQVRVNSENQYARNPT